MRLIQSLPKSRNIAAGKTVLELIALNSMRLLVVGHSYLTAYAQAKYVAMKQLDSNLEIRLVVPREVPHPFKRYQCEVALGMSLEEVVTFGGYLNPT